jgi:hypothetical protein
MYFLTKPQKVAGPFFSLSQRAELYPKVGKLILSMPLPSREGLRGGGVD